MAERYFLDSNIIMYAIGAPHPLKEPCIRIVERIEERQLVAVTDTEILQEILYRYYAVGNASLALDAASHLTVIVEETFPVLPEDIQFAMQLLRQHGGSNVRDAIHCATMVQNKVRSILTADRHFDQFPQLRRIDPADFRH